MSMLRWVITPSNGATTRLIGLLLLEYPNLGLVAPQTLACATPTAACCAFSV